MSDHDMSESSCMESPRSYGAFSTDSPSSSPSQMVPHLTTYLTELSCGDGQQHNAPFLRITEQPQNHFRFRYVSEMIGTHGCLLGKSYPENKSKTHPTVELVNYSRQARIRCQLSQHNSPEEHPHKLQEDEQDRDVSYVVPEHGSYKVGFAGMGIIHTAKKDVPKLLYTKMADNLKTMSANQLKTQCETKAKGINLNIVRLKFTAHDLTTGEMICEPVFSEPIHNMKSAATNDLKICRISRLSGRPRGGDDVFILVEKVNKKNIMIRFYELSPSGEEIWTANGNFVQTDVHHQYAIVFRTPPYKNTEISSDTTVYIELVRPSDGRTSEPKEFVYKADTVIRQTKKRRMKSYSSLESTSDGSIKSISEIPATVEFLSEQRENIKYEFEVRDYKQHLPILSQEAVSPGQCDLANALVLAPGLQVLQEQPQVCPMWNQATGPTNSSIPNLNLNSLEFEKVLNLDPDIPPEERKMLSEGGWLSEYMKSYGDSYSEGRMDFMRATLLADSGRSKGKTLQTRTPKHTEETRPEAKITNENGDYLPVYKVEDAVEVKKLVKELCDIIRVKKGYNKEEVQNTLERLFDIRLTNGDRFLHMALFTKQPSFDYIVKMMHGVKMTHLFDLGNDRQQTILHMAIINDRPNVVTLLISKGCNPMAKDCDDDNTIHYAVRTQSCLVPLLDAIKRYKVPCDLNQSNNEKQSPLHLAAMYNCAASARALLQHGASYSVRDTHGRTPLHLAAYDDKLLCARALLDFIAPIDIDIEDGRGNTALQIVCGGTMGENTLEFVRLLLEKQADPLRRAEGGECAWRLARGRPALRDALVQVLPHLDDVKSEPEEDFLSADEGEGEEQEEVRGRQRLREQGWARTAAARLDRGGWHALARRLAPSLLPLLPDRPSPTLALLDALEAQGGFTAETLATALEEVGQPAIAQQIRRYIE